VRSRTRDERRGDTQHPGASSTGLQRGECDVIVTRYVRPIVAIIPYRDYLAVKRGPGPDPGRGGRRRLKTPECRSVAPAPGAWRRVSGAAILASAGATAKRDNMPFHPAIDAVLVARCGNTGEQDQESPADDPRRPPGEDASADSRGNPTWRNANQRCQREDLPGWHRGQACQQINPVPKGPYHEDEPYASGIEVRDMFPVLQARVAYHALDQRPAENAGQRHRQCAAEQLPAAP